jgi:pimeloyl-ACP methyl ester carboxylesterase
MIEVMIFSPQSQFPTTQTRRPFGVAFKVGLICLAMTATACEARRVSPSGRGTVVSSVPLVTITEQQAADPAAFEPFDDSDAHFGVHAFRVTYRTIDAHGQPTIATGMVAVPDNRAEKLHVISYAHGTRTARRDVASVSDDNLDRHAVLLMASAGYAVVAPDYLGLGEGPGHHPYMDTATETTASVDMLRAARRVLAAQHRTMASDVLVTGFSQGGPAAMALGQALTEGADAHLGVAALAPISGPYDALGAELPGVLTNDEVDAASGTFYLAYWTVSMNRLHHLYNHSGEVFMAPYSSDIESWFDGTHDEEQIIAKLPDIPAKLFLTDYLQLLAAPVGALLDALHANDQSCVIGRLDAPVHLFAADGDRDITITNTRHCLADLTASGHPAEIVQLGDIGHFPSQIVGIPAVLHWFTTIATPNP